MGGVGLRKFRWHYVEVCWCGVLCRIGLAWRGLTGIYLWCVACVVVVLCCVLCCVFCYGVFFVLCCGVLYCFVVLLWLELSGYVRCMGRIPSQSKHILSSPLRNMPSIYTVITNTCSVHELSYSPPPCALTPLTIGTISKYIQ